MAVFDKAKQHREESVVETVISCLAYYTNKQEDWFTLIKPDFIEFLCSYLMSPDQVHFERNFEPLIILLVHVREGKALSL